MRRQCPSSDALRPTQAQHKTRQQGGGGGLVKDVKIFLVEPVKQTQGGAWGNKETRGNRGGVSRTFKYIGGGGGDSQKLLVGGIYERVAPRKKKHGTTKAGMSMGGPSTHVEQTINSAMYQGVRRDSPNQPQDWRGGHKFSYA